MWSLQPKSTDMNPAKRTQPASMRLNLIDGRGRDGCCQPPPAQIPACAANAPGSSLGSTSGGTRFETASDSAHSRQSDGRGNSAQCPNNGRLSAVSLG